MNLFLSSFMAATLPVGTVIVVETERKFGTKYLVQKRLKTKRLPRIRCIKITSPNNDDDDTSFLKYNANNDDRLLNAHPINGQIGLHENVTEEKQCETAVSKNSRKRKRKHQRKKKMMTECFEPDIIPMKNVNLPCDQLIGKSKNTKENMPSPPGTGTTTQSVFQNKDYQGNSTKQISLVPSMPVSILDHTFDSISSLVPITNLNPKVHSNSSEPSVITLSSNSKSDNEQESQQASPSLLEDLVLEYNLKNQLHQNHASETNNCSQENIKSRSQNNIYAPCHLSHSEDHIKELHTQLEIARTKPSNSNANDVSKQTEAESDRVSQNQKSTEKYPEQKAVQNMKKMKNIPISTSNTNFSLAHPSVEIISFPSIVNRKENGNHVRSVSSPKSKNRNTLRTVDSAEVTFAPKIMSTPLSPPYVEASEQQYLNSQNSRYLSEDSKICLENIIQVLNSHYDLPIKNCVSVLEKNCFNILTTLQELQFIAVSSESSIAEEID